MPWLHGPVLNGPSTRCSREFSSATMDESEGFGVWQGVALGAENGVGSEFGSGENVQQLEGLAESAAAGLTSTLPPVFWLLG